MANYSDRSDPGDQAVMNWVVAGMAMAGAVWVGWTLGWPWVFDMDDPAFNPMILLEGVLIAVAALHIFKAWRWRARSKVFGAADLEIIGRTPVTLGNSLSGVLRLGRPVAAAGEWTLKLTCFDIHETRDTSTSPYRKDAYPVWSTTFTLPADINTAQGLPFKFQLPASVGPKPVRPLERKNPYFSFTASVNIPGLKRVLSRNTPPVARSWNLLVTAPTSGPEFRVEFPVPVED